MAVNQSITDPYPSESWKPVVGYEDYYEVSDYGRVRSLDRECWNGAGWWTKPGRLMKLPLNGDGYHLVSLSVKGKAKSYKVHRLVLEAFEGPCPEGMEGAHNNGIPTDNRLVNLRYCTHQKNNDDKNIHGTSQAHRVKAGVHYPARLKDCKRGHVLAMPNLAEHALPARRCLACKRTHMRVRRNPELKPSFQEISDSYYADIMR